MKLYWRFCCNTVEWNTISIGFTDVLKDIDALRKDGVNIIVGTPGRVSHILATYPEFKVRELDVLVLDEADRLLSMGFESSLNSILAKLPKQRRTVLYLTSNFLIS
jgi:ATP-dependent RNA helicase DDX55/SPB4